MSTSDKMLLEYAHVCSDLRAMGCDVDALKRLNSCTLSSMTALRDGLIKLNAMFEKEMQLSTT